MNPNEYVTTAEAGAYFSPPLTAQQILNRIRRKQFKKAKKFGWQWAIHKSELPIKKTK